MQAAVFHVCHTLHRVLVVNAYGPRQGCIPTTIETMVLLASFERFGRLPLEEFTRVPILPPPNLSLESGEVSLVDDDQIQIARIRAASHCRPSRWLRGDTEADLAAPAQVQVPGVDTRPFGHHFQEIAVAAVLRKCPRGSGHQVPIRELQRGGLRKVVQRYGRPAHRPVFVKFKKR
jgi:hypothetical protein